MGCIYSRYKEQNFSFWICLCSSGVLSLEAGTEGKYLGQTWSLKCTLWSTDIPVAVVVPHHSGHCCTDVIPDHFCVFQRVPFGHCTIARQYLQQRPGYPLLGVFLAIVTEMRSGDTVRRCSQCLRSAALVIRVACRLGGPWQQTDGQACAADEEFFVSARMRSPRN